MLRLFGERGGDPDRAGKSDELDALMWRAQRPGEPSWPSPFGPGRPGWHVECAAIALSRIGTGLDIQGGGSDLIFPHHEFSAAHAECVTGERRFARHYVHAGMIGWDGHKMSKSRGNLVLVSRLRADGVDPAAIRLGLLAGHYRSDRSWSDAVLEEADARLQRWRDRDAAARGAGRDRCGRQGAPLPGRRPRHPESACRAGWLEHRCARVRRPRHRGPATGGHRGRCAARDQAVDTRREPAEYVRAMSAVNGKVVLITGGARGVGAEVARRLHDKGAKLVLTDIDEELLKDVGRRAGRGPGADGRRRRARSGGDASRRRRRRSTDSAASTS